MKKEGLWPTGYGTTVFTTALIRCAHDAEREGEDAEAMLFRLLLCLIRHDERYENVFRHLLQKAEDLAERCPSQQDGSGIDDGTGVRVLLEACDQAFTKEFDGSATAAVKCAMALLPDDGRLRLVRHMLI